MSQIIVASAIPGVGKFFGIKMPDTINNDALAYIGAAVISYVLIRILWAPYAIWKDDQKSIENLNLELSLPHQILMRSLAKHRAKARAKLSAKIEGLASFGYFESWEDSSMSLLTKKVVAAKKLEAEAGLSPAFIEGFNRLVGFLIEEAKIKNENLPKVRTSRKTIALLQSHLMGDVTAESLALQLPQGIESETPL